MGDIERLRRLLWPAVMASPLLTGCDSSEAAKSDSAPADRTRDSKAETKPDANEVDATKADADHAEAGQADDSKAEPVEPVDEPIGRRPVTCEHAHWCGSPSEAKGMATPQASLTGKCVSEVTLPEGTEAVDRPDQTPAAMTARLTTEPVTSMLGDELAECCYEWTFRCLGGRPLLDGARALAATPTRSSGWAAEIEVSPQPVDARVREQLASAWLVDALVEHASVAAFARATLELMAVGAPAQLVAQTQRAGLDEVRHASLCFGLARAYGARAVAPGPCPLARPRSVDLVMVARSTFVEGCVGETIAAVVGQRAAACCTDRSVRRILQQIADDEARHAALAWRTVRWALARDRRAVEPALLEARSTLEAAGFHSTDGRVMPHWPQYGRLGVPATQVAAEQAWEQIIVPMLAELLC